MVKVGIDTTRSQINDTFLFHGVKVVGEASEK